MSDDSVDEVIQYIFSQSEVEETVAKPARFAPQVRQLLLETHGRSSERPISYPTGHGAFPENGPGTVPPIVLDANRLRNDIRYACRTGQRTVLVNAANAGLFRLFCAQHVVDEVAEHSEEFVANSEIDRTAFLRRWLFDYLPLIRILQNDAISDELLTPDERSRIEKLRRPEPEGDPDDVPSARLALVLGAFYLSGDQKALTAVYGPGVDVAEHDKWLEVLKAGGDAGELGQMLVMASRLGEALGTGAAHGVQALWRRIGPIGAISILVLAVLLARRMRPETRAKLGSAATTTIEALGGVYAEYQSVLHRFQQAAPQSPTWEELARTAPARAVLIRASLYTLARVGPSNCSATELRALLPALPVAQGEARVREILRSQPCFSEVWRGRWQVGQVAPPLKQVLARRDAQTPAITGPSGSDEVQSADHGTT